MTPQLSQRLERMLNAGTSEGVRKSWEKRKGGYSTVTMPSTVGDDDVNVEFEHDPGENGSPSVGESVSLTSVKDKSGKDLLHTLTPQQKDAIHKEIWAYKAKLSKDVSNVASNVEKISNKPCGGSWIPEDHKCGELDVNKAVGNKLLIKTKAGGFTYQPISHRSPSEGFAVSGYAELERTFDPKIISEKDFTSYWNKAQGIFKKDKYAHMGGWLDKQSNRIFLDVVRVFPDQKQAEMQGRQLKELAIFDLGAKKEIRLQNAQDTSSRVHFILPRDIEADEAIEMLKKFRGGKVSNDLQQRLDRMSNSGTSAGVAASWNIRRGGMAKTPYDDAFHSAQLASIAANSPHDPTKKLELHRIAFEAHKRARDEAEKNQDGPNYDYHNIMASSHSIKSKMIVIIVVGSVLILFSFI